MPAIATGEAYRNALREVVALAARNPSPDTYEGERLAVLAALVEAYEKKHFPIAAPTALDAALFREEQARPS